MTAAARTAAAADRHRPLVDGEYLFTAEDFRALAGMLHADAGIALAESKATLVYSRLAKRLRILGLGRFSDYCDLVASGPGSAERRQMLTALTTNVTRFFREPHHFEHLKQILPPLLDGARGGGRVRLWSAASSTGEEPYSIGLTVLSLMPDAARYDIKILATDIDANVLARGQAGIYDGAALGAIPAELRRRWFARDPSGEDAWAVAAELRQLVNFRELNLIGSWPMRGRFQAIMCRNVVIYFNEQTQATIWQRFTPLLESGGYLYIGHSERLTDAASQSFESVGVTTYRRCGSAAR